MKQRNYIYLSIFTLCIASRAMAQDVTVHSDPRLAVLIRKNHPVIPVAPPVKMVHKAAVIAGHNEGPLVRNPLESTTTTRFTSPVPPVADNEKQVHRYVPIHSTGRVVYSGKGFRVQVYSGPDRGKAIEIKAECMRRFPSLRTYISYISPCFRVKVGDYRNRYEAESVLKEANTVNSPSMIVPDLVAIRAY